MPSWPGWARSRLLQVCIAVGSALLGACLVYLAFGPASVPEPPPADSVERPNAGPTSSTSSPEPSADTPSVGSTPSTSSRSPAEPSGTPSHPGVIPDQITGPVLPESNPVSVAIPRIGVRSSLVRLGLDRHGELEVPQNPARAGWFTEGAAPGALGPAVIAGHVTWNGTPGVFYRLGTLRPGDRVTVTRADGRTAVFTISRVARFPKSRFPTQAVYGPINHAGLRLITCGGTYDASRHRYLANVVAFARLSAVRRSQNR